MTHRFVATSYNIWTDTRWPEREDSLRAYLTLTQPDLLCLQELQPDSRAAIDEVMPGHTRVEDDFEGWLHEGNIYWSTAMFSLVEHGIEDLKQQSPLRRLFWVRLTHEPSGRTVLVTTAHYTFQGNQIERAEGYSPRNAEADRTIAALERLAREGEPVLFMGDLNDNTNAIWRLRQAGLLDSFTACGAPLVPTHPAPPTATGIPQVLDWMFHRGPVRAMNSHVGEFFEGEIAPSDHKPVVTTYALT